MSESETTPIIVELAEPLDPNKSRWCGRPECMKVIAFVAYFSLLLWRFSALVLFSIHVNDCMFREKHTGYSCKNFTLFSHANALEIAWQMTSVINTLIAIAVLVKVPDYQGYLSSLRSNSKHARFWSLFLQLIAFVISKIVVIVSGLPAENTLIEIDYIFMAIPTTLVVYLWNGVPTPWKESTLPTFRLARVAYILTLVVFNFEYFYMSVATTAQAAYQVTGLYYSKEVSSGVKVITVVLHAAETAFCYTMTKFFWNKWFYSGRNLLIDDSI